MEQYVEGYRRAKSVHLNYVNIPSDAMIGPMSPKGAAARVLDLLDEETYLNFPGFGMFPIV